MGKKLGIVAQAYHTSYGRKHKIARPQQADLGKKQDPISRITREKGLKW
jgi:hypothetical protein